MLSNKYISAITIVLVSVVLVLCVLAMAFSDKLIAIVNTSGYSMEYEDELFDTSEIIEIDIKMDEDKWNELLTNASLETYYECDVTVNGKTFNQVAIRPKGNTSLSSIARDPYNNRYSFKMEFDRFVDGQTCFGLDKLVLNNNYADTTNMKEAVIYDMFRYLDADASLYNYAKISVNGEYWGVYLALEAVEDSFMLRNYGMEKGYLYKPDSMNFKNNGKEGGNKAGANNFPAMPEGGFEIPENFRDMWKNGNNQDNGQNGSGRPSESVQDSGKDLSAESTESASEEKVPTGSKNGGMGGFNMKNMPDFGNFGGGERGGRGGFGGMGGGSNLNYSDDSLDSYTTIWNSQINDSTDSDHKRVVEALKNVHGGTNIEKYIDVDQILKYMAVHNFAVNDDSLSGSMAHNYYLYEGNGRISVLPWDYNLSLGGMHGGNGTSIINDPIDDLWQGTKLFDFVFQNEEYKARYHEYYNKLVEEYLYGGKFEETYNRIRQQIDALVEADPNAMYTYEQYTKGADAFYDVVMLRAESVKGQLEGTIPSTSEGQKEDSSALVDASGVNLSNLGQFMMGGGGFGGNRNNNRQDNAFGGNANQENGINNNKDTDAVASATTEVEDKTSTDVPKD